MEEDVIIFMTWKAVGALSIIILIYLKTSSYQFYPGIPGGLGDNSRSREKMSNKKNYTS